jgi:triacylglycerol lipase
MHGTELRVAQADRAGFGEQCGPVESRRPAVVPAQVPDQRSGLLIRTAGGTGRELVATAAAVCSLPVRLGGGVVRGVRASPRPPLLPPLEDGAARPVVLVHGFAASTTCWSALRRALRADGRVVATFDYWPWAPSVGDLAHRLVTTVEDLLAVTGADKVDLVGHSLGGVVIAQALTDDRLAGCVDRVVTLGSPFGGTVWARLFPAGPMVWELRPGSPLLRHLAAAPPPTDVTWLAFASRSDQIVSPDSAVPVNRDATLVTIEGAGHSGMLLAPDVIAEIVAETRARNNGPRRRIA